MIITSTISLNVTDYRWRSTYYDAVELARYADEALSQANPGDFVRIVVDDMEPAPVPESFAWVREDLVYTVEGPFPAVNRAWKQALMEAQAVNHG